MNKVKLKSGSLQAKAEEISVSLSQRLPLPSSAAGSTRSSCAPKLVIFSNRPFPRPTKTAPKPLFLRFYLNGLGTDQVRRRYD